MRIRILALLLAAMPPSAGAQTLYRCVQPGQPTSFQSAPCAANARTASALGYVSEPDVPVRRPVAIAAPPSQRRQPASSGARLHQIPMATSTDACAIARANREAVLGPNNQRGNVEIRRVLNDAVAEACY